MPTFKDTVKDILNKTFNYSYNLSNYKWIFNHKDYEKLGKYIKIDIISILDEKYKFTDNFYKVLFNLHYSNHQQNYMVLIFIIGKLKIFDYKYMIFVLDGIRDIGKMINTKSVIERFDFINIKDFMKIKFVDLDNNQVSAEIVLYMLCNESNSYNPFSKIIKINDSVSLHDLLYDKDIKGYNISIYKIHKIIRDLTNK